MAAVRLTPMRIVALTLLSSLAFLAACVAPRASDGADPVGQTSELVTRITTLKEGGARLDWLEDRIAFDMLGPDDFFALYVMRSDGNDVRCLSCGHRDLPGRHTGQPAWHPSGRYLVFQAEKRDHEKVRFEFVLWPGAGVLNDLWLLDLETNRATLIREVENERGRGTLHPHFSADGRTLSWTEMVNKGGLKKGTELGFWALMVAEFRTEGGKPRLENVRAYTPGGKAFYENHGFSPDGSRLIFTSNFEAKKRIENHIYVLELKTQKLTRLTTEDYNEHALFSPDGRHIAWMSSTGIRGRGTDYWLMNSDGSNKRRLTFFNQPGHPHHVEKKAVVADLAWRPDGTAIAGYYHEGKTIAFKKTPTKIILIELDL